MRVMIAHKLWHVRGGVERYVLNLTRLLQARGHEVVPFTCAHPRNEHTGFEDFYPPYRDLSSPRFDLGALKAARNIVYSAEARKAVARLLDVARPDVVHCRNIYHHLSPSILYEFEKRGIPVVMTAADYKLICPCYKLYHGGRTCTECKGGRYSAAVRHRCVKGSRAASLLCAVEATVHDAMHAYVDRLDLILSPSRFLRDTLADFGLPEAKLGVLQHFIDAGEWRMGDPPQRRNRPNVVCFGRLSDEKGIEIAISAVGKAECVDLRIVGEGPEEARLRAYAEKEAPGLVEFLGYRDGEALRQVLRESLAVVVPSIWYEPFGLSILEAFALGRPVVGSRIGNIPELVIEGRTGSTFEAGDADGLAQKLTRLADHPEDADAMGREARRMVEAEFGPDAHYEGLMRAYASIRR